MFNQIKYAARAHLSMRLVALGVTVLMSMVFAVCGASEAYGFGGRVTAVCLVSVAHCGLLVVNILADERMIRAMFTPSIGYLTALTPVPGWKILLGRVIPIVVWDLVSLVLGTFGIVINSFILAGVPLSIFQDSLDPADFHLIPWGILLMVLFYTMALLAVIFGCAVTKSFLFRLRGRGFLGFLVVCAVAYLFSLADLALSPFVAVYRWGLFISPTITVGWNPGMVVFLILTAAKLAALFFASARLLERKVNI